MMSHPPGKLHLFWRELKRRKIFRSLAIYAGTAFVILEASTIIFPRWNFPDWTIDLVLYLLIFGALVNLVIAWFYDITPDGIQRTQQITQREVTNRIPESTGWKAATFISLLVVAGLVLYNIFGGTTKLKAGDIRSLVILPFENYTGDDQLNNMVAGMHSMLIGDMGRISNLRVIGKTSSNQYKDVNMSAGDIAGELHVDAVVEATVMSLGDSVYMQFRLVSTGREERQLWVGEYHEDKSQILNLYNRVTKQIAHEVQIKLTDSEEQTFNKDRTADRDAIDAYIMSYAYWSDLSPESMDKAEKYLMEALEKDPNWAPIHAGLAALWAGRMQMGMVDPQTGRQKINSYIERARELDEDFADSHFINGILFSWTDWEWEKGEREFLQALALNPNHVMARIYYAHLLMILQRMDEALEQGKLAVDLDPKNPLILSLYSAVLKGAKMDKAVLEYVEKALAIDPDHVFSLGQLGRALYGCGEYERNLELQETYLSERLSEEQIPDLVAIYQKEGQLAAYKELATLREEFFGDPERYPLSMARYYYWAGAYEKSLDILEKWYQLRNPNMPYIGTGSRYEALQDSARFLAILDGMNLPHPARKPPSPSGTGQKSPG